MRKSGYVIVEGNIGVGKSTFSDALTKAFWSMGVSAQYLPEPDEVTNPFLAEYYADPKGNAYKMQAHLLSRRYMMTQYAQWGAMAGQGWFILDRSFYGDVCFANLQRTDGYFTDAEFTSYVTMHHAMETQLHFPTAAIFLKASVPTLKTRISKRMSEKAGRECECAISDKYLTDLQAEIDNLQTFLLAKTRVFELKWEAEKGGNDIENEALQIAKKLVSESQDFKSLEAFSPWGDVVFNFG